MNSTKLPVFYSPKMVAFGLGGGSPSPGKPRLVLDDWIRRGIPLRACAPEPATREELERAHLPNYVERVLSCEAVNGFGNRHPAVASSLPWTSGAMLSAARHALYSGKAACAPVSGFHHASYTHGSGFCTFNGLMVAALALLEQGVRKIGIIDCDYHYGDGTQSILELLQPKSIKHWSAGRHFHTGDSAQEFFGAVVDAVQSMFDCEVILYQAGADAHIRDPLGGFLTTEELRLRDSFVFSTCVAAGLPVAWNLAGGYQEEEDGSIPKVLEIHRNTALECIKAFDFQGIQAVATDARP